MEEREVEVDVCHHNTLVDMDMNDQKNQKHTIVVAEMGNFQRSSNPNRSEIVAEMDNFQPSSNPNRSEIVADDWSN